MKTKHTDAPWSVADYKTMNSEAHVILSPNKGPDDPHPVIASVHKRPGYKCNAYLIASAPVMLEALKKASTCASIPDAIMELIREAIKLAEGR